MDIDSFITMVISLFAITAPIAVLPIFIALTTGQSTKQKNKTALIATGTYLVTCLSALFIGNAVLAFFGVSVAALRVAGMAVVVTIGWKMLNAPMRLGDKSGSNVTNQNDSSDPAKQFHHLHIASNTHIAIENSENAGTVPSSMSVGIMPLGFPIYGGPGVLSVIIAWGSGAKPVYTAALIAILINAVLIILIDFIATPVSRLIGIEGLLVTEKIFGLIILSIAVTGIASALLVLFPGLAGV